MQSHTATVAMAFYVHEYVMTEQPPHKGHWGEIYCLPSVLVLYNYKGYEHICSILH